MTSGYNSPGSGTWHSEQRCSGSVFSAVEAMGAEVAYNRGLSPCGNCCGGEWPDGVGEDEDAGRSVHEWLDKIEDGETAIKLTSRTWAGPEWVTMVENGTKLARYPVGFDEEVSVYDDVAQLEADIKDADTDLRTVPVEETPLSEVAADGS